MRIGNLLAPLRGKANADSVDHEESCEFPEMDQPTSGLVGNVTSSHTQSLRVLMTGFFIAAGRRTVSPRLKVVGSLMPSTRTCASPSSMIHTTGSSYGTGSSTPSVIRTFSSLKYGLVTRRVTVVKKPATWLRGCFSSGELEKSMHASACSTWSVRGLPVAASKRLKS